jgi:hypothetical protein
MRIAIISMFANEAAIAPAFLDQANEFADALLMTAHNSFDATQEIVQARRNRQDIVLAENYNPQYVQSQIMTDQMQRAFLDHGADVVVPLDFDEYLPFDSRQSFEHFLSSLQCDIVELKWRNLAPSDLGNPNLFSSGFYFRHNSGRFKKVIVMRSAFLKDGEIRLSQGSHHVVTAQRLTLHQEKIHKLLHIPIHGRFHYRQKMLLGAARIWLGNHGALGGHWTSHAEMALTRSDLDLKSAATCYPDIVCNSFHNERLLAFSFPYVKSLYNGEEESARQALLSNCNLISSWLLKTRSALPEIENEPHKK